MPSNEEWKAREKLTLKSHWTVVHLIHLIKSLKYLILHRRVKNFTFYTKVLHKIVILAKMPKQYLFLSTLLYLYYLYCIHMYCLSTGVYRGWCSYFDILPCIYPWWNGCCQHKHCWLGFDGAVNQSSSLSLKWDFLTSQCRDKQR